MTNVEFEDGSGAYQRTVRVRSAGVSGPGHSGRKILSDKWKAIIAIVVIVLSGVLMFRAINYRTLNKSEADKKYEQDINNCIRSGRSMEWCTRG